MQGLSPGTLSSQGEEAALRSEEHQESRVLEAEEREDFQGEGESWPLVRDCGLGRSSENETPPLEVIGDLGKRGSLTRWGDGSATTQEWLLWADKLEEGRHGPGSRARASRG